MARRRVAIWGFPRGSRAELTEGIRGLWGGAEITTSSRGYLEFVVACTQRYATMAQRIRALQPGGSTPSVGIEKA